MSKRLVELLAHVLHRIFFRRFSSDDAGCRRLRVKIGVKRVDNGELSGSRVGANTISALHTFNLIENRVADAAEVDGGIGVVAPPVMRIHNHCPLRPAEIVSGSREVCDVHIQPKDVEQINGSGLWQVGSARKSKEATLIQEDIL